MKIKCLHKLGDQNKNKVSCTENTKSKFKKGVMCVFFIHFLNPIPRKVFVSNCYGSHLYVWHRFKKKKHDRLVVV